MRSRHRDRLARTAAAICATALLCAACGQDGAGTRPAGGGGTSGSTSTPATRALSPATGTTAPAPGAGATALTVVAGDGSGTNTTWKLRCDPPGGDHPDAAAACAALEARGATALPPVPKGEACTMIYGGPQTATVTGTWRGQRVSASFNRTNGCEIARWEALTGLLPSSAS